MNAQAQVYWSGPASETSSQTIALNETSGGYRVSPVRGGIDYELVAESTLKFFGLVMLLSAAGHWIVPAEVYAGDATLMKLSLTASFILVGLGLYWHAHRGFRDELQVDVVNRELRLATRNSRGEAHIRRRIPMRDIESSFIRRSRSLNAPSQLVVRLRGVSQPLTVLSGSERDLTALHDRIGSDLRALKARVAARAI